MVFHDSGGLPVEKRGRGRPKVSSVATMSEAAVELFLESGYDAISIDDIALRAGVSRGSFFAYLPGGKPDALWHYLLPTVEAVVPVADESSGGPVAECIDALATAVEPWGNNVPQVLRDAELMGVSEILLNTAGTHFEAVAERLAAHIGVAEHVLPESPRPATIARALVGGAAGAIGSWMLNPGEQTAADAVRQGIEPLKAYELQ